MLFTWLGTWPLKVPMTDNTHAKPFIFSFRVVSQYSNWENTISWFNQTVKENVSITISNQVTSYNNFIKVKMSNKAHLFRNFHWAFVQSFYDFTDYKINKWNQSIEKKTVICRHTVSLGIIILFAKKCQYFLSTPNNRQLPLVFSQDMLRPAPIPARK